MNLLINGCHSPDRGAVTSIYDILMDHVCDLKHGIHTFKFERLQSSSLTRFNYRATPYRCLKKLFDQFPFSSGDHFVDFGCGKGRVYLYAALCRCQKVTGVEYDDEMVRIAVQNQNIIENNCNCELNILHADARTVQITETMNRFFLFVPFHIKTFGHILRNIKASLAANPRHASIIFYRPDLPWIQFMEHDSVFSHQYTIKILNDPMIEIYTNYDMTE